MQKLLAWLKVVVAWFAKLPTIQPSNPSTTKPDNFAKALPAVLKWEGGWTDHPRDPGGATYKGVTIGRFASHRGVKLTASNAARLREQLRNLSDKELALIYRKHYWDYAQCALLPTGLDLMHFDCAVNQGPNAARRLLQTAVGAEPDGVWGPITLSKIASADPREAILAYSKARETRYRQTRNFDVFGRGWLNRLRDITAVSLKWLPEEEVDEATVPSGEFKWMEVAKTYLHEKDMRERRGGENQAILDLWKVGRISWTSNEDETPWCAVFWNAVNEQSGIPGNNSAWARDGLKWGVELDGPAVGATAVFSRGDGGHIGFIVGRSPNGNLEILGGNQSNTVSIAEYPVSRILGYRWPDNTPLPEKVGMGWLPII